MLTLLRRERQRKREKGAIEIVVERTREIEAEKATLKLVFVDFAEDVAAMNR